MKYFYKIFKVFSIDIKYNDKYPKSGKKIIFNRVFHENLSYYKLPDLELLKIY